MNLTRLELSPMHGLLEVSMTPAQPGEDWTSAEVTLCGEDGLPVGFQWYTSWGGSRWEGYALQITQFIPTGAWPDVLYLAELGEDGRMDPERSMRIVWE